MSFAFWRKCDFQVHSPRDPSWNGQRPLGIGETVSETGAPATAEHVETARAAWAKAFVDECVTKGLEAVALTDHHEMVMVAYVQREIEERRQADPEADIWVFPGMEPPPAAASNAL